MRRILVLALALAATGLPLSCKRTQAPTPSEPPQASSLEADYRASARESLNRGLAYFRGVKGEGMNPDRGDWGDPGLSSLVMTAIFLGSETKPTQESHPFLWRGLEKLASFQKGDGSIYQHGNATYVTSTSLMAFSMAGDSRFLNVVKRARTFLLNSQVYEPGNKFNGGFGYEDRKKKAGGPYADLVNTEYALEALHRSGVSKDDKVWKRSIEFLTRCQHFSEKNPASWVDVSGRFQGGFVYFPGQSKAGESVMPNGKKVLLPYGSVTYAGVKSMIFANLTEDDPRVAAALNWIQKNWTLDNNPGFDVSRDMKLGKQGLFYYYVTFAKTLHALNRDFITDDKGAAHDWRRELVERLVSLQKKDGSWKNHWHQRWWEGQPLLATSYAVIALSYVLEK